MPAAMITAHEVEVLIEACNHLSQMRGLPARTLTILSDAEQRRDERAPVEAVRETRGTLTGWACQGVVNDRSGASV